MDVNPPRSFRMRAIQSVVSLVVVIVFFALGYLAIRQFLGRQWLISCVTASLSLMCIPLVDHTAPFRERLAFSLIMPFGVAGLAVFVLLYFQMFRFPWFEAVFNDKGTGPAGLMIAAMSGLVTGGFSGWHILSYFGWAANSGKASLSRSDHDIQAGPEQ